MCNKESLLVVGGDTLKNLESFKIQSELQNRVLDLTLKLAAANKEIVHLKYELSTQDRALTLAEAHRIKWGGGIGPHRTIRSLVNSAQMEVKELDQALSTDEVTKGEYVLSNT